MSCVFIDRIIALGTYRVTQGIKTTHTLLFHRFVQSIKLLFMFLSSYLFLVINCGFVEFTFTV